MDSLGLIFNPLLLFIALFVWIGAAQEASMTQVRAALGGIPVSGAMLRDFQSLSPRDPLGRAVDLTMAGSQADFPVVEDRHVMGILTRNNLLQGLAKDGWETPVGDVMSREFQEIDESQMLETALARLQQSECQTLPVTHHGDLVGLLTADNIGEFVMIQSALGANSRWRHDQQRDSFHAQP